MSAELVHYEPRGDVAVLTIDSPPVNSLRQQVVEALAAAVERANADPQIRGIVITGAGGNFIAGADIGELQEATQQSVDRPLATSLTEIIERLEANAKPIVMAIDGFALGGGLEVAMGGHYRLGTPRCRVGLPELKLGLIPGAGGTQRLPRLAGVQKAAEMMLLSTELAGPEAVEAGVVQKIVEPERLIDEAVETARKLATKELPSMRASQLNDRLGSADEARQIVDMARLMMAEKARNLVHPELCLDAILTGAVDGYAAGLRREAENFAKCLASPQAKGLIHMFFATRAAPKVPGVSDQKFPEIKLRKAAVLGGGTMGSGIATALVSAGIEVVLKEVSPEAAEAGRNRVSDNLRSRLKKGRLSQADYDATLARLRTQQDYAGFDDVDLVIEAVVENVELKQQVFADLEQATRPDCVLATNTSTIDIEIVGARTKAASRIVGTHFFSPAHVMPLVEIVRSRQTAPPTVAAALQLAKRIKKTPVTVGNCVGFLVNRVFFPYGQAACLLVDRGVDPYAIDRAIFDFGMPMGPFRMSDLAGVDVAKFAGGILAEAYAERTISTTLVDHLFAAGRFGQKAGRGYYRYPDGKTAEPDPELAALVEASRADAGHPRALHLNDDEIVERIFFPVVNECCRTLEEGIALRASDIDVASVMGMGFPAYRGGVMKYADMVGAAEIASKLTEWGKEFGPMYEPCAWLLDRAGSGKSLEA